MPTTAAASLVCPVRRRWPLPTGWLCLAMAEPWRPEVTMAASGCGTCSNRGSRAACSFRKTPRLIAWPWSWRGAFSPMNPGMPRPSWPWIFHRTAKRWHSSARREVSQYGTSPPANCSTHFWKNYQGTSSGCGFLGREKRLPTTLAARFDFGTSITPVRRRSWARGRIP